MLKGKKKNFSLDEIVITEQVKCLIQTNFYVHHVLPTVAT